MTDQRGWRPISRDEALALGWRESDDGMGKVTRAWDEWFFVDQEQRAWVSRTVNWSAERYDAEWERIQSEPGDPGGPDPFDLLTTRMGGLLKHEHEWLTVAALVRDAVSAYEVYLAKAFDEVLASHKKLRRASERTPNWQSLVEYFRLLGVNVRPREVDEILELRNVLTHKRGEVRSPAERARFAKGSEIWGARLVHLDLPTATECLDELGKATRAVDPLAWAYAYGGQRVPGLLR